MTITYKDILDMQEKVIHFNEVMGNSVDDKSLIPTYIDLTKEESKELLQADEDENHEEVLDAIVDMFFTGSYWWCLAGEKLVTQDAWLRSNGWKENLGYLETVFDMLRYIEKEEAYDFQTMYLSLISCFEDKYDIVKAFNRVYESNLSKTCLKKDVDVEHEIKYIESQGRYSDVFTEEHGEYVVFKARKDLQEGNTFEKGKIVKSSMFKSVEDLGGLNEFIY